MGYNKNKREYNTAGLKSYPAPPSRGLANLASKWSHLYVQRFTDLTFVPMHKFLEYTLELQRTFNLVAVRGKDHHRSDAFN